MQDVFHCTNCKRHTRSALDISAYFDKTAIVAYAGDSMIFAFQHEAQIHDQSRHFCARFGTSFVRRHSAPPEMMRFAEIGRAHV